MSASSTLSLDTAPYRSSAQCAHHSSPSAFECCFGWDHALSITPMMSHEPLAPPSGSLTQQGAPRASPSCSRLLGNQCIAAMQRIGLPARQQRSAVATYIMTQARKDTARHTPKPFGNYELHPRLAMAGYDFARVRMVACVCW